MASTIDINQEPNQPERTGQERNTNPQQAPSQRRQGEKSTWDQFLEQDWGQRMSIIVSSMMEFIKKLIARFFNFVLGRKGYEPDVYERIKQAEKEAENARNESKSLSEKLEQHEVQTKNHLTPMKDAGALAANEASFSQAALQNLSQLPLATAMPTPMPEVQVGKFIDLKDVMIKVVGEQAANDPNMSRLIEQSQDELDLEISERMSMMEQAGIGQDDLSALQQTIEAALLRNEPFDLVSKANIDMGTALQLSLKEPLEQILQEPEVLGLMKQFAQSGAAEDFAKMENKTQTLMAKAINEQVAKSKLELTNAVSRIIEEKNPELDVFSRELAVVEVIDNLPNVDRVHMLDFAMMAEIGTKLAQDYGVDLAVSSASEDALKQIMIDNQQVALMMTPTVTPPPTDFKMSQVQKLQTGGLMRLSELETSFNDEQESEQAEVSPTKPKG